MKTLLQYNTSAKSQYLIYLAIFMFTIYSPASASAHPYLAYGKAVTGMITHPSEKKCYYFKGDKNDLITINMSRPSGDLWPEIELYGPANELLCGNNGPREARIDSFRLIKSGRYKIIVMDGYDGKSYGEFGLVVQNLSNPCNIKPMSYGTSLVDTISFAGAICSFSFYGHKNDLISIQTSGISGDLWQQLELYSSEGKLSETKLGQESAKISSQELPVTGNYSILVLDGYDGTLTGSFNITLKLIKAGTGNNNSLSEKKPVVF